MNERLARRALTRRLAVLGTTALLLPGLAVVASAAPAASGPPVVQAVVPAADLLTSWPAVDVADRLQPWLADTLISTAPDTRLRVMVSGETTAAAAAAARSAGLTVQQSWDKVGIVVGAGLPAQIRAVIGQPGVRYVEGDQPLAYSLDTAHSATRSDVALETYTSRVTGQRIDGSGVSIAVIDSGIDSSHPMFNVDGQSKVVQNRKNACGITFEPSTNEACFQPVDDTDSVSAGGHGTHVSGIAAGLEVTTTAPAGVELRGSAPGAKLVGLSVGAAIGLLDSNAAMTWVVDHQQNPCRTAAEQSENEIDVDCPPIRATNHSYGPATAPEEGFSFDENSATVTIQRMLVSQGVTPVWAAGNSGGDGEIAQTNPPGMDPTPGVLMVASYNDGQNGNRDNQLSGFSSRGKKSDPTTYPDISAPGDLITSACRPQLSICQGAPSYDNLNYQTISGTSMATPYIAGVVAQLAQANPLITPGEGEQLLEDTAHEFVAGAAYAADPRNADSETAFDKGHGLVDVHALLAAQQGLPVPGEPAPICSASSPQVVDSEGDATQIIAADTGAQSQNDLDVVAARLTWDGGAQELTFQIQVSDLAANPGADEFFRFYVSRESDAEVFAVAERSAAGEVFAVRQQDAGTRTEVTGSFDEETNTVTVVLPAEQYAEVIPGQTITEGDNIGVGQVLGQRRTGLVTATADTAVGSCPFVVAESGAAQPEPDPQPAPAPDPAPEPGPDPDPDPSPSEPDPDPNEEPQPDDSEEPQPDDSEEPQPDDDSAREPGTVRSLDSACPQDRVPPQSRADARGNEHERAIDCMVWWEIARGTSDTTYEPTVGVTREQMAAFVARLIEESGASLPAAAANAFSDDDTSHHHASINQLAAAGVVDGKGEGVFAPKEIVNRAQMSKFIVKAYEFVSDQTLTSSKDYFDDDNGHVLEEFINASAEAGFTVGRNGGYEPTGLVLRDQMAAFLARTLDLLVGEGTTPAHP